jgi:uncharacterized protein with PQ loop repeat
VISFLAVTAAVFGVVMGASPLLQLRRIIRLNSSRDVSTAFFSVVVIGQLTWVAYGLALRNPAVIASNGCGMLVNLAVLIAAIWIRKRHQPS